METLAPAGDVRAARRRLEIRRGLRGIALALLVGVLAWSAGGKLFWPGEFQRLMATWGLIPPKLIPAVAYTVPASELVLAAALVVRRLRVAALFGVLYLAVCFSGIHAFLIWAGTAVPCGCAGLALSFASRPGHIVLLGLSLALALAATLLLFTAPRCSR